MNNNEPISIGTCIQITVDTIGQDALLDYLNETNQAYNYDKEKQFLQRLKKREEFNQTTYKNLMEFSEYFKSFSTWLLEDDFTHGMTVNQVDRILCSFSYSSLIGVPKKYGMFISMFSICRIYWELFNFFRTAGDGNSELFCMQQSLGCLDYFDIESNYLKQTTIFKRVFCFLDQIINDKKEFYKDWNSKIYVLAGKDTNADIKHQIDRWANDDETPKWKLTKAICSKKSIPDEKLFKELQGLSKDENTPEKLWSFFRKHFLTAYLIKNHFNSLIANEIITKEQKDYIVEGIRHMFRFAFYQKDYCKADAAEDLNFMFHALQATFRNDMPGKGMESFFNDFIPDILKKYSVVKIGLQNVMLQKDIEELIS